MTTLRGVFTPALTPFKADLSPDIDRWIAHCQRVMQEGCHGVCPFGTTSEANSLGFHERMDMLDALVESVPAEALMPGTGACAIPDTVALTAHAVKLGCAGVLMLPPFYYKGMSDEGIFRSIAEVIERVGDDRLRVYLYHIPPVAQIGFSLSLIERLRNAYPTIVVGLKDSTGDPDSLQSILDAFPGFATFAGSEKLLLQNLRGGGAGTISAMNNLIAGQIRYLYDNWEREDADQIQAETDHTRSIVVGYAPIPAMKEVIAARHNDPAWRTVRPPLVELTQTDAEELRAKLGLSVAV